LIGDGSYSSLGHPLTYTWCGPTSPGATSCNGAVFSTVANPTVNDPPGTYTYLLTVAEQCPSGGTCPSLKSSSTTQLLTVTGGPSVSIDDQSGAAGSTLTFNVTVALPNGPDSCTGSPQPHSFSVGYNTKDGSAIAPGDYTSSSGSFNFTLTAGTSQTLPVQVQTNAEAVTAPSKNFTVVISSPNNTGVVLTKSTGTGTISYVQPGRITLSLGSVLTYQAATLTVSLDTAPTVPLIVTLDSGTTGIAALSATTLTFNPNQPLSKQVTVTTGAQTGAFTITATPAAANYLKVSQTFQVANQTATLATPQALVGLNQNQTGTLTLPATSLSSSAWPAAGVPFTLSTTGSGCSITGTNPITVLRNLSNAQSFTFNTGSQSGACQILASAPGFSIQPISIAVTSASIVLTTVPTVGPGQSTGVIVSLTQPLSSTITIQLTSDRPDIATITPATVTILAHQTTAAINAQVTGVMIGTTTIHAQDIGNPPQAAPTSQPVTVAAHLSLTPASVSVTGGRTTTAVLALSAPAPAGGLPITVDTQDHSIATDERGHPSRHSCRSALRAADRDRNGSRRRQHHSKRTSDRHLRLPGHTGLCTGYCESCAAHSAAPQQRVLLEWPDGASG
jgi:hypothetical protein